MKTFSGVELCPLPNSSPTGKGDKGDTPTPRRSRSSSFTTRTLILIISYFRCIGILLLSAVKNRYSMSCLNSRCLEYFDTVFAQDAAVVCCEMFCWCLEDKWQRVNVAVSVRHHRLVMHYTMTCDHACSYGQLPPNSAYLAAGLCHRYMSHKPTTISVGPLT